MPYKLPTRSLRLLEELFQDRQKADFFVEDIEKAFQENEDILRTKVETSLKEDVHKLELKFEELKVELKEDNKNLKTEFKILEHELSLKIEKIDIELKTEIKILANEMQSIKTFMKWLIGLIVLFGTLLNPTFVEFLKVFIK